MHRIKEYTIKRLFKSTKPRLSAFFVLAGLGLFVSCAADNQRYHNPSQGTPPSFENDMGVPENEKIFSRGRSLF